jgi:LmbE family N-acetylglucosaminyl deacetylase
MNATTPDTRHDWTPRGETVLGIWAHPDDEAYLSAGLMTRAVRAGGRVVCVHATRGEQGTPDPDRFPPPRLAGLRTRELAASLRRLGVHDSEILGYPDGGCAQAPWPDAVGRLSGLMRRLRPDYVVTFGPDGITGHPDHVTVSRWATAAWSAAGHGTLLYSATTRSFVRRFAAGRRLGLRLEPTSVIPDEQVALAVRLTEDELDTKRAALAAHASQTDTLAAAMGERTYRRWYDVEAFRAPTSAEIDAARAEAARADAARAEGATA